MDKKLIVWDACHIMYTPSTKEKILKIRLGGYRVHTFSLKSP
jgi:hypothetical protein